MRLHGAKAKLWVLKLGGKVVHVAQDGQLIVGELCFPQNREHGDTEPRGAHTAAEGKTSMCLARVSVWFELRKSEKASCVAAKVCQEVYRF